MPQIRVLLGYQQGHVFSLRDEPLAIGRDPKSAIVLHPDSAASRRHAEIFAVNGHWRVRDLGSVNGTSVNGRRVRDEALRDKDELVIGDNVFVFEERDPHVAQMEEAASRVNPSESRGYANRPATQVLARAMPARCRAIEDALADHCGGRKETTRTALRALIAGGHLLLDGAAEGYLRGLAELLGLKFARIEAVPEPSCVSVGNGAKENGGANTLVIADALIEADALLRANVVLADGLQRAPMRLRERVLEMMEEAPNAPFLLAATQTVVERGSSYPFTEAQLDRFMFSIAGEGATKSGFPSAFEPVLTPREILELQRAARELPVSDHVARYAVRLARATRPADAEAPAIARKHIHAGAGPQAVRHLLEAAKAQAILEGRLIVRVADAQAMAPLVLRHRIFTNFTAAVEGVDADRLIAELIAETAGDERRDGAAD